VYIYSRIPLVDGTYLQSTPMQYIGYAAPEITNLAHNQCELVSSSSLTDCPRSGGGTLTVTGTNLGNSGAVVLVGGGVCSNVAHVVASTVVTCTLPSGTVQNSPVIFIQQAGAMSLDDAVISYILCPPGTYQNGIFLSCVACPTGTVTTLAGQFLCTDCSAGTYQSTLSTSCDRCISGRYSGIAQSACDDCVAGKYALVSGSPLCLDCPAGSFQSSIGHSGCDDCVAGRFQGATGATECLDCDVGKYSSSGRAECTYCEAGTYQSVAGSSACINCPYGKYKSVAGVDDCVDCLAGTFTSS